MSNTNYIWNFSVLHVHGVLVCNLCVSFVDADPIPNCHAAPIPNWHAALYPTGMLSCCPFIPVNLHLYAVYKSVCMYDQEFGCSANDAARDEIEECEEEIVRVKRMMQERKMKQDAIQSTLIRVRFIPIHTYTLYQSQCTRASMPFKNFFECVDA